MTSKTKHSTKKYISPFAQKMNAVAIRVLICGSIITTPLVWSSVGKPTDLIVTISRAIAIVIWFYLTLILSNFIDVRD